MARKKGEAMTFADMLKGSLYKNRNVLYNLQPPKGFLHRIEEKNELVMELSPILMNSAVSCVFVYGTPGTGKSGLLLELMDELKAEAKKAEIPLETIYVNCSENRTETVILVDIMSQLDPGTEYPRMGWTRTKAGSEFQKLINKRENNILIILDEVDYALKEDGDDILYRLSRLNTKVKTNVSTIIISNDVKVGDYIKPRTQSAFGRVRVIFSPYNSEELFDIMNDRASLAFKKGATTEAVLAKIAEIEASRSGDARKALEMLDACAKIAIAKGRKKITLDLVDEAVNSLEKDSVIKTITGLAKHQKILYLTLLKGRGTLNGTTVYKKYKEECSNFDEEPLTERRVRTFLVEFSNLGLIKSEVGWLKDLRKKSRKITLDIEGAIKNKVRKLLRDSI